MQASAHSRVTVSQQDSFSPVCAESSYRSQEVKGLLVPSNTGSHPLLVGLQTMSRRLQINSPGKCELPAQMSPRCPQRGISGNYCELDFEN